MTKMIAEAAPAPATGTAFPPFMIVVWLLFIGGFYFLFIAPQKKKQKEHERMLGSLQSGDEVVTTGGIFGTITNVKEDRFVLKVADNTKIEIGKAFVQSIARKAGGDKKSS